MAGVIEGKEQGVTVEGGQLVRLKAERARAYGFDPSTVYRVLGTFTSNGYKVPWVRLEGGEMAEPNNVVKATELRA